MNTTAASTTHNVTFFEASNYAHVLDFSLSKRRALQRMRSRLRKARLTVHADPAEQQAVLREALDMCSDLSPNGLDPRLERRIADCLDGKPSPYGVKGCVRRLDCLLRIVAGLKLSVAPSGVPALGRAWFKNALALSYRR